MKYFFYLLALFCFGCGTSTVNNHQHSKRTFIPIKYSKLFGITETADERQLFHLNEGDTFWGPAIKKNTAPLKIAVLSTVFAGFIEMLGAQNQIVAIEKESYYSDAVIQERIKNKSIVATGEEGQIQLEKLLSQHPDIIVSGSRDLMNSAVGEKLKKSNIKIVYCDNFREQHPLARAEWLLYFGAMLNLTEKADSIFKTVTTHYLQIADKALDSTSTKTKPLIMTDALYGDSWFVPGGNSYTAQLIADAGGRYVFKNKTPLYTYPLSIEEVLVNAEKADIWIHTNQYASLAMLQTADRRYTLFKPYKQHTIFNNNKQENANGGNDFWEIGVGRPDIILEDLYNIFSGDSSRYQALHYYKQLQ
ncbi:MAG: ABC transporter substrate-binding protein [Bacteroidota bacterium]